MKITLKKAHVLSQRLLEIASQANVETIVTLSALDTRLGGTTGLDRKAIEDRLSLAAMTAISDFDGIDQQVTTAYRIREKAAVARTASGVSALLAEKAGLETTLKRIKDTLDPMTMQRFGGPREAKAPQHTADVAEAMFSKLTMIATSIAKPGVQAPTDTAAASVAGIVEEHLKDRIQGMRRRLSEIGDRLIELNYSHHVELDEAEVALLRKNGLVD